jgi:hypothetical protein
MYDDKVIANMQNVSTNLRLLLLVKYALDKRFITTRNQWQLTASYNRRIMFTIIKAVEKYYRENMNPLIEQYSAAHHQTVLNIGGCSFSTSATTTRARGYELQLVLSRFITNFIASTFYNIVDTSEGKAKYAEAWNVLRNDFMKYIGDDNTAPNYLIQIVNAGLEEQTRYPLIITSSPIWNHRVAFSLLSYFIALDFIHKILIRELSDEQNS